MKPHGNFSYNTKANCCETKYITCLLKKDLLVRYLFFYHRLFVVRNVCIFEIQFIILKRINPKCYQIQHDSNFSARNTSIMLVLTTTLVQCYYRSSLRIYQELEEASSLVTNIELYFV